MNKGEITRKMEEAAASRGCFLVDVAVGRDNDIVLTLEKDAGSVSLEDCTAVNDAFLAAFDKDAEDYALTVTSAGLDQPFKVLRQYRKAIGTQVDVRLKGGLKLTGELMEADEAGAVLKYSRKEAVEGSKKKVPVEHTDKFPFETINSVVPHIAFESYKQRTHTMEKKDEVTLIDAFKDFKEEKNIDRPVMMGVLKDVFLTQIAKTYGSSDNFDVIINIDKGDCEIYQNFDIVEEVENPNTQITLEQIKKETGDDDYEIGDVYTRKLSLDSFGRRGILNIRQNLQGRIMDIDKANVFKDYSDKVGELFTGEIYQTWSKEVVVLDEESNELHLPKAEQIPGERFKKGDAIRAIIKSVEMKNNTTPYITLSRTSNEFLEKLFEQEVPEIFDGLITIKKVVRIPGERAKVAVESYDERIDPIGACIGVKGSRIIGIVRELRNENIDVLQWTANTQLLIQRALNPARVTSIDLGASENDKIKVYMQPEEVKKGIGRGGCNIKLAGMLAGREIEVWRELPKEDVEEEEDVLLDEFSNEIDQWVIDRLKAIGCDTAKSVLAFTPEDVAKRADLEDETVAEVFRILKDEFED